MSPQVKLGLGALIVAVATGYLAYLGASASWQYYLHVDECVDELDQFVGHRVRVSGRVAQQSLELRPDRSLARFVLTGQHASLAVSCKGPLPDNLSENIEVVVEGTLDQSGHFYGDKLMTRCASKYQPEQESKSDLRLAGRKKEQR